MNILLGVTGSVAATLTSKLCRELKELGNVKLIATERSLYFFNFFEIDNEILFEKPLNPKHIYTDEDEFISNRYKKTQDIPHITLGNWADIFVIAPLTCNTLAKIANGICDNLLTNTYMAWDTKKPIIVAPAMNTKMWNHPATISNLKTLNYFASQAFCDKTSLKILSPIEKELACGDVGEGAMCDITDIVSAVREIVNGSYTKLEKASLRLYISLITQYPNITVGVVDNSNKIYVYSEKKIDNHYTDTWEGYSVEYVVTGKILPAKV